MLKNEIHKLIKILQFMEN